MENKKYDLSDVVFYKKSASVTFMVFSIVPIIIILLAELVEDGFYYFDTSVLWLLIYVAISLIIGLIAVGNSNRVIEFAHNEVIAYNRAKKQETGILCRLFWD